MTSETTGTNERTRPERPARKLPRLRTGVAVALLCIMVAACEPPPIPGAAPLRYRDEFFAGVTKTTDVVYGTAVNQLGATVTLKLDVYRPTGDTATSRPLVIFVHGGSFCCLNKSSPEILDETSVLTKKGYVTASIDYRLSTHGCTRVDAECAQAIVDAREDAQASVRFFRTNASTYGVDPSRIAIAGTSAGAITALNVAYTTDGASPSSNVSAAVSLSGAALGTSPDTGEAAALLFHGTADPLVPYQWALNTVNAARAKGLLTYLITWEGEGHVPYLQHRTQILDLTTNFLYRQLDLGSIP